SGATAMNTTRTCDGLGTCLASEVQNCDKYRCTNGRCLSSCTTNADCADGIACVSGSCGPKVDGQPCTANADCQNMHCVRDAATGPGICCNSACDGACRSCNLAGTLGRCTMVANGGSDPRNTCMALPASSCMTDGKCDGSGL